MLKIGRLLFIMHYLLFTLNYYYTLVVPIFLGYEPTSYDYQLLLLIIAIDKYIYIIAFSTIIHKYIQYIY